MGLFDSTTTQNTAPWKPSQPYLKFDMAQAQNLYKSGTGYTPAKVAGFTPQQIAAQQGIMSTARGDTSGKAGMGVNTQIMNGGLGLDTSRYLDMYNQSGNPYFQGVINQQAQDLTGDIGNMYSVNGRYGGGDMVGTIARDVGDLRNKMASDNWNQNFQNQMSALGGYTGTSQQNIANRMGAMNNIPMLQDALYDPYGRMAAVGQEKQAQQQKVSDQKAAAATSPWQRLQAMMGSSGASQAGTGSTTNTQQMNPWATLLGGGLTLASMWGKGGA